MNAPLNSPPAPPPVDIFEDLFDTLWGLKVLAENAQGFAQLHDTDGLHYVLKRCDETLHRAVALYNEARGAAHANQ